MKLDEVLEVAVCNFYERIPIYEKWLTSWAFWAIRKSLLYGTCYYIAETLFGHRRRPHGSSTLRLCTKPDTWLPKRIQRHVLDESGRTFLTHLGYRLIDQKKKKRHIFPKNAPVFYSDVKYPIPINPLPDEEPLQPVEGEVYPPGFHIYYKTLNIFAHFPIAIAVRIWKSCEILQFEPNDLLFENGDVDNSFHIILSGSVSLSIEDEEFGHVFIKYVNASEHILSLLTIMKAITGFRISPKPVRAHANQTSVVIQVPVSPIVEYFMTLENGQKMSFFVRTITKIREIYFQGMNDLAGLNKYLTKNFETKSSYEPFEFDTDDPIAAENLKKEIREGLSKYIDLTDEQFETCTIGIVRGGKMVTHRGQLLDHLVYIYKGELMIVDTRDEYRGSKVDKVSKDRKKFVRYSEAYHLVNYQRPGNLVGTWSLLTNSKNYYSSMVPEGQRAIICEVPVKMIDDIWLKDPLTIIPFIKLALNRWTDFAYTIDYCLHWSCVPPGKIVYRQGDAHQATFFVLSGRLRYRIHYATFVHRVDKEAKNKFGLYDKGDWFGFVESLASENMHKTVVADRYSEILMIPGNMMTLLYQKYPDIVAVMTNYLSIRVHREYNYDEMCPPLKEKDLENYIDEEPYQGKKKTRCQILAVFPLKKSMPGELFCTEIQRFYPLQTRYVSFEDFKANCHDDRPWQMNLSYLIRWLTPLSFNDEGEDCSLLILLGNPEHVDLWNTVIARQADFIQILATTKCSVKPTRLERMISNEGWKAVKDFIFLYPSKLIVDTDDPDRRPKLCSPTNPRGSCRWLNRRPWLDIHHHVRFPKIAWTLRYSSEKEDWDQFRDYKKLTKNNHHNDMARIGRWLSNTMVGLVLGGGGAKGAAHIGILEYLEQLDLPIDCITGVSIGAFVGGLLARFGNLDHVESTLRGLFHELEKPERYMRDVTVPISSFFRGRSFDEFVKNTFQDTRIEDLWVPYFCITTDVNGRHSRSHKKGLMWFYVRASMTLTMIFPPLSNPSDNHLLMDGGYSEILPGNHLRVYGVKYILALDIGDENGIPLFNIGYECSGIRCVLQNMCPFNPWPNVPTRANFWEQLNYIAARKYVQLLKKSDRRVAFIRPAVEFYNGRDFRKFNEIRMMGYYTTAKRFEGIYRGLPIDKMWALLSISKFESGVPLNKPKDEKGMPIDDSEEEFKIVSERNLNREDGDHESDFDVDITEYPLIYKSEEAADKVKVLFTQKEFTSEETGDGN